jgi:hypothetical protein
MNENEQYYEFYERVAILLENNPDMTETQAHEQAKRELQIRKLVTG